MANLSVRVQEPTIASGTIGVVAESVTFIPSDDPVVTSYEVRIWTYPADTLAGAQNIGNPIANPGVYYDGVIHVDPTTIYASVVGTYGAGTYTMSIATIGPGGTTDSEHSAPFTLPR